MTPVCPPDLRAHYRAGRLIPFVGAGVSASVEWENSGVLNKPPSWSEMVDEAAAQLEFQDPGLLRARGTDLQILEFYNAMKGGMDELVNWLVLKLAVPDEVLKTSLIHSALVSLEKCPLFYTTNYDDLLERAFELHGRSVVRLSRESDFPAAFARLGTHPPTCQLVKFHGDLKARETMVVTEAQYEERLKLETALDLRMRSDLLGRAVLFIGYSFRDPNVSYLFRLVNEEFRELPDSHYGQRAFIAIPDPSEFERRLFQRRRIDVIALDSADVAGDVAFLLEQLAE